MCQFVHACYVCMLLTSFFFFPLKKALLSLNCWHIPVKGKEEDGD